MAAPPSITKWINEHHPRPAVDPDWLRDCCAWIASSYSLSPTSNADFTSHVTSQFFQSNLTDSTLPNTGLPADIHNIKRARLAGPPCLVEIRAIGDIAHSAFSLMNVRQNRMDRADLAGLVGEGNEDAEDEGPVPKYPRGMLRLELSDGFTTVEAVEYRSVPQLELGVTPLGYKILLKDVQIRRGIIFLEPKTIELKGYQTEDHELMQDEVFLRSLSRRLGKPDPNPEPQLTGEAEALQRVPSPVRAPSRGTDRLPVQLDNQPECSTSANTASTVVKSKSVTTVVSKTGSAPGASKPSSNPTPISPTLVSSSKLTSSLKPPSNHSALSTSPYFSTSSTLCSTNSSASTSSTSNPHDNPSAPLARARILPPAPRGAPWGFDDEEFEALVTASPPMSISKLPRPPSPPSDYEMMDIDMDDDILAEVEKMEANALATICKPSGGKLDANVSQAQGGSSARVQASTTIASGASQPATSSTTRTPRRPRANVSTQRHPQNIIPQHAGLGTIMSSQRRRPAPSTRSYSPLSEDVIDVDSDGGKENVPLSAQTRVVDDEVIDISD